MSCVLVTGSSGYIGSNLMRRLHQKYDDLPLIGLDRVEGEFTEFVVDMTDKLSLVRVITDTEPVAVIHLAALIQVGESEQKPSEYWRNNFVATLNLLDTIKTVNPKIRLIFMSSAAVYGHSDVPLTVSGSETKPMSVYGQTKLACEQAIRGYCQAYQLTAAIVRLFNIGGGIRDPSKTFHLIPIALKRLQNKETFSIFGCDYNTVDGTCERSYVHVYDLVDTYVNILDVVLDEPDGYCQVYNVSAKESHSVMQIIASVIELTQQEMKIKVQARRPGDPGKLIGRLSELDLEVVTCEYKLEDIIKDEWNSRNGISLEISETPEK